MMTSTAQSKQYWRDFMKLYKSLPALWKIKSDCYKNRNLKTKSYELMIAKLKEVDPNADRELVKRKINSLRSNYRKELKKVLDSKESGAEGDEVYVPSLWYYKDLEFLTDHDNNGMDSDEEINPKEELIKENANAITNLQTHHVTSTPTTTAKKIVNEVLAEGQNAEFGKCEYCNNFNDSNDEADILGQTWAMEYKKLKPSQQLFAKKAINDILFEASLDTLHRHSVIINSDRTINGASNVTWMGGHFLSAN